MRVSRSLYPKVALFAVSLVFVALTSIVVLKTPAWEGDDETDHVQNIETLAAGHWYRIPAAHTKHDHQPLAARPAATVELHQPPLYYLVLAGIQRVTGERARDPMPGPNAFPYLSHGRFRHHTEAQHRFLLLLRFPNVFFGLLAILFTFLTVRLVSSDPWTPVVAAAVVAFAPRFVFVSSFVTNDNLVNVLGAVLIYVSVRYTVSPSFLTSVAVATVLGLLVITKLSALSALAVLAPVALSIRPRSKRLQFVGIAIVTMLAVCGWYLVQNTVRYGDPLAAAASQRYLTPIGGLGTFGAPYVVTDPLRLVVSNVPSRIWKEFWYGWNRFRWPATTSLVLWLGLAFALSGLLWTKRAGDRRPPRPKRDALAILTVCAVAGFVSVWIVAFSTGSYSARLALLGLPPLACLAALGLERWRLTVRLLLPLLELIGAIVAVQQNVLGVSWSH